MGSLINFAKEMQKVEVHLRLLAQDTPAAGRAHREMVGALAVMAIPCLDASWQVVDWSKSPTKPGGAQTYVLWREATDEVHIDGRGRAVTFKEQHMAEIARDLLNAKVPGVPDFLQQTPERERQRG